MHPWVHRKWGGTTEMVTLWKKLIIKCRLLGDSRSICYFPTNPHLSLLLVKQMRICLETWRLMAGSGWWKYQTTISTRDHEKCGVYVATQKIKVVRSKTWFLVFPKNHWITMCYHKGLWNVWTITKTHSSTPTIRPPHNQLPLFAPSTTTSPDRGQSARVLGLWLRVEAIAYKHTSCIQIIYDISGAKGWDWTLDVCLKHAHTLRNILVLFIWKLRLKRISYGQKYSLNYPMWARPRVGAPSQTTRFANIVLLGLACKNQQICSPWTLPRLAQQVQDLVVQVMGFWHHWKSLLPSGKSHLRKLCVKPQECQSFLGQSFCSLAGHKNALMVKSFQEASDGSSSFCLRCTQARTKYTKKHPHAL